MKPFLPALFLTVFSALFCQNLQAQLSFESDFKQARAKSKATGKPMLAMFYGKW